MTSYLIDLNYIIGTVLIMLILTLGLYYFADFYMRMKRDAPGAKVQVEAKKRRLPIVKMVDAAATNIDFVGAKGDEKDIKYLAKESIGLYIDPAISGGAPSDRTINGIPVYTYFINSSFPQDSRASFALVAAVKYIRENYPELDFITDDRKLITLLFTPATDLIHDCTQLIHLFEPSEDSIEAVLQNFEQDDEQDDKQDDRFDNEFNDECDDEFNDDLNETKLENEIDVENDINIEHDIENENEIEINDKQEQEITQTQPEVPGVGFHLTNIEDEKTVVPTEHKDTQTETSEVNSSDMFLETNILPSKNTNEEIEKNENALKDIMDLGKKEQITRIYHEVLLNKHASVKDGLLKHGIDIKPRYVTRIVNELNANQKMQRNR